MHYLIIFLFTISGFIAWITTRDKKYLYQKYIVFFVFITLFLLSALRDVGIGNDTHEYIRLFNLSVDSGWTTLQKTRYETGFLLFTWVNTLFYSDYRIFLAVTSFVIFALYYFFVSSQSQMPLFSALIFYCFFFSFSVSGLRQSFAMTCICLAYPYALKKSFYQFAALVGIAYMFHNTAILFLPAYFIINLRFSKWNIAITFVVSVISILLFANIQFTFLYFFKQYQHYTESIYNTGDIRPASVSRLLVQLFFSLSGYAILWRQKYISKIAPPQSITGLFNLQLVALSVCVLALKFNALDRISNYFSIFIIIYIPNLLSSRLISSISKFCSILAVSLLSFLHSSVIYEFRPEWNRIFPYKTHLPQD